MKGVARKVLSFAIETVYPPRCMNCPELTETPAGLCRACWAETTFFAGATCDLCGCTVPTAGDLSRVICEDCNRRQPIWDHGRSAVAYEGTGRRVVMALKHGDRLDMAPTLARWMHNVGYDLMTDNTIIVPVPLHWRRLLTRKFNQASELGRHIASIADVRFIADALHRNVATPSLRGLKRDERQAVLSDTITMNPDRADALAGASIVIVDDVMTTGATLTEATQACRQAGAASVSVLCLARVQRPE